jgi:2-haloacid dehalogenase
MFGFGKHLRPKAIAFDIIGTSFPLDPLRADMVRLGLPRAALEGWFAAGLRDAFALAAAGDFEPFATVLEAALNAALAEQGLSAPSAEVKAMVEKLQTLPARSGLDEAFRQVTDAGCVLMALSNGSAAATKSLLDRAGLRKRVDHIVSVDDVKLSKPRAEIYHHGARAAGVKPAELALVAAHPWDINGAKAAGLVTAYLSADRPFSPVMRKPDVAGENLPSCVQALLDL